MAAQKSAKPTPLAALTIDTFKGRVGEKFRMHADPKHTADVELVEVNDLTEKAGAEVAKWERAPFSLVFRGPLQPAAAQGICKLEHAGIGNLEIFLVPIGPDKTGMRYEAIFT